MSHTSSAPAAHWPNTVLDHIPDRDGTEALARQLREGLCGSESWDAGPLDTQLACAAGGFDFEEANLGAAGGGLEALLVARETGFRLRVDSEPRGGWQDVDDDARQQLARHRLRFRLGHEWAHSFFFCRSEGGPQRTVAKGEALETFCDEFARELLVPGETVRSMTPTIESAVALQHRFDVSLEVAVRALAAAYPDLAILLWVVPSAPGDPAFMQWRSPESYERGLCTSDVRMLVEARAKCATARTWESTLGTKTVAGRTLHERRQVVLLCN